MGAPLLPIAVGEVNAEGAVEPDAESAAGTRGFSRGCGPGESALDTLTKGWTAGASEPLLAGTGVGGTKAT
jgi:hypothetical protein